MNDLGDYVRITDTPAPDNRHVGETGKIRGKKLALYGGAEVMDYLVGGVWHAEFCLEEETDVSED